MKKIMKKIIKLLLTIPLITTPFYFSCSKNEPPKKQEKNELLKQIEQLEKEIEKLKNDKKELQKKLEKLSNEKKEIVKTNQTIKKDLQKTKKLQVSENERFTISNNARN